jgi:hypothetical protein
MISGVIVWFILQWPFDIVEFFRLNAMFGGKTIFEIGVLEAIRLELSRYYFYFWKLQYHRNMFLLLVFLISVPVYLTLKDSKKWIFLIPVIVPPFVYTFIVSTQSTHTILYMSPFLMTMTSVVIDKMLHSQKTTTIKFGKVMLFSLCLFFLTENFFIFYIYRNVNFNNFVKQLKEYIPEKSNVLGPQGYWVMLPDTEYYSIELLPMKGKPDIASRIRNNNIEYIIIRESTANKEIKDYVEKNCTLLGEIVENVFGSNRDTLSLTDKNLYKTKIYKVKYRE